MTHFLQDKHDNGSRRATPGLKSLLSGAFSDVWNHFLSNIFDLDELWRTTGTPAIRASLNNISDLVDARTKIIPIPRTATSAQSSLAQPDRKGSAHVTLDSATRCNMVDPSGRGLFSDDFLEVQNPSNRFMTFPATASVCRGRWMYEALLLTNGIMQIGWMNPQLVFKVQFGVGDVFESFAFDGSRRKKWGQDMATAPYGLLWSPGDVLGCLLDLDNKVVSFTLNGVSMGEAWNEIPTGPNTFYAPAATFSEFQHLRFNFGATPFRYPVQGFAPIELQSDSAEDRLAPLLLKYYVSCLQRMLPHLVSGCFVEGCRPVRNLDESLKLSETDGTILLATLFSKMSPLFLNSYAVVDSFVPFLLEIAETARSSMAQLTDVVDTLCDPDECESLWTICLGELCQRATREAYPALMQTEAEPIRTGKEYREIAIYFLSNRRVLRHVYRSARFPLFLEQIYNISEPSRADMKALFPHPWWPGSTEDFSSYPHMKRALNKLTEYNDSLYRSLVGFTTSLLSDTEPLHPITSGSVPVSIDQAQLASMGKNSISNWIDLYSTVWNSPASLFLLWAACWVQNRKPHLGELTNADSQEDRVAHWTANPPRVLDSLFAVLIRYISTTIETRGQISLEHLIKKHNLGLEIFLTRSPAFWMISDCVGGDLRATRRELGAKFPHLKLGADSMPRSDTILSSVIRVCVLHFPDRCLRLDLDTLIDPNRSRTTLAASLKQIKISIERMKVRRETTTHIEKLLEETRALAVGLAMRHAVGIAGKYSPTQVKAFLDFGTLLVRLFFLWATDSSTPDLFKLVPLHYLHSINTLWQSLLPLTQQESLESTELGSLVESTTLIDQHGQLGVELCWALCSVAADLRVLNPQERSQLMYTLVSLLSKNQAIGCNAVLASSETFLTALARTLLSGFNKEQTAPIASQFLLDLWYEVDESSSELANAFNRQLGSHWASVEEGSADATIFNDFLTTLIAKLNFNVTEMVRSAGDVVDRNLLLNRVDKADSEARREASQSLEDANARFREHSKQTTSLLLLLSLAPYCYRNAFLDRVRLSVICGPIQFMIDRLTSQTSPFRRLMAVLERQPNLVSIETPIHGPLLLVLNALTVNEDVRSLFISVISRDLSLKSSAFRELLSAMSPLEHMTDATRECFATLEKLALDRESNAPASLTSLLTDNDAAAAAAQQDAVQEEDLCNICCSEPVDTIFRPCNHTSCGICIRRQLTVKPTCFMCNQLVDSLEPLIKAQHTAE